MCLLKLKFRATVIREKGIEEKYSFISLPFKVCISAIQRRVIMHANALELYRWLSSAEYYSGVKGGEYSSTASSVSTCHTGGLGVAVLLYEELLAVRVVVVSGWRVVNEGVVEEEPVKEVEGTVSEPVPWVAVFARPLPVAHGIIQRGRRDALPRPAENVLTYF